MKSKGVGGGDLKEGGERYGISQTWVLGSGKIAKGMLC